MSKLIVCLAWPGVQLLDISGPLDVFAEANTLLGREIYRLRVMGLNHETIVSSSGVKILPDLALQEPLGSCDTFLVAGAPNAGAIAPTPAVAAALQAWCRRSRRYGSICTGALLLAGCGLLDGYRVTTHWAVAEELANRYPRVVVNPDELYVCDGPLRTAAGVTSGLDLALKMVEEDLGRDVALEIAANLVMFFKRPVGQLHFSRRGRTSLAGRSSLQDLQRWAIAHLDAIKNVKTLAGHMNLSVRHFTRIFQQELNTTPAEWLEQERVAKARYLLESSPAAPKEIAAECGFSSVDILRRTFLRQLNTTPTEYRKYYLGN
ncbi:GlxA family transcriptional regulator [Sodalis sp. RH21]|uniref:GlxA family transcriptional regulator n=1 Tax=unclassified Sodalis (in: enterobacteria) TaxID=2636512 RepID=UPI0039B446CE